MLLSDADHVIALDMNPTQNALLRLKIAAIRVLERSEMLAFLGITPGDRRALWHRVRKGLTPDDQGFWDRRQALIRRGIWYAGLWEKVLRFGARGTGLLRGRHLEPLFAAPDTAVQAKIWARHFDDRVWRASIRMLARPWVWTRVIGEPGGAFLPDPREVEARLAGAFNRASGTFLFRTSDFASLILRGRTQPSEAVPLHLEAGNYARIRDRLDRIEPRLGGLHELDTALNVDSFSLSDFGSYTSPEAYAAAWRGVIGAARPGARFVERLFMNPLPLPDPRIALDESLSARLTATDRAIIYDIRAGVLRT
jgi:S-adenosylmethionine-diacylglycerol 3-amino-3-carboxypropyl transferase